jgi:hypothetical protein
MILRKTTQKQVCYVRLVPAKKQEDASLSCVGAHMTPNSGSDCAIIRQEKSQPRLLLGKVSC